MKRLLGPRDGRLKTRRCASCRTAHLKCDEKRPCSACLIRNRTCSDTSGSDRTEGLMIVQSDYQPRCRSSSAHHGGRSSENAHLIHAFFQWLGDDETLPLALKALSPSHLSQYLETDGALQSSVIAVGATVQGIKARVECGQVDPRLSMLAESAFQRAQVTLEAEGNQADSSSLQPQMLCGVILHTYLLMTDDTATRVVQLFDQLLRPLCRRLQDVGDECRMDRDVFRLFWVFDMIYSSLFDQDSYFTDTGFLDQTNNWLPRPIENFEPIDLELGVLFEFLMKTTTRLLKLAFRATAWLYKVRDGTSYPPPHMDDSNPRPRQSQNEVEQEQNLSAECQQCLQEGIAVSTQLMGLKTTVDRMYNQHHGYHEQSSSQNNDDGDLGTPTLLQVYTSVALLSLSRAFDDPLWLTNNQMHDLYDHGGLLHLTQAAIDSEVALALHQIEERFLALAPAEEASRSSQGSCSGLEGVLYLPALATLALEVQCSTLRVRVSRLLSSIELGGFTFAGVEHRDIQLAWSLTGVDRSHHLLSAAGGEE